MPEHNTAPSRISWHSAFFEALQMDLYDYRDSLEFHPEYQLTFEPLRIDCVVVKKAKDVIINKNIGTIFREWNIMEYKSPGDYVSVADFYKVYGYACLYTALQKVPISTVTVSFVGSRYPQKLIKHLREERCYTVAETGAGIYTVKGDILPIQIIDSRRLPEDGNLWLKSLRDRLDHDEMAMIGEEMERQEKDAQIGAYLNAITRANPEMMEETYTMRRPTFEEVFTKAGIIPEWIERGVKRGHAEGQAERTLQIARKLKNRGRPLAEIAEDTGLTPEAIEQL